jgi:hypothetical protein
MALNIKPASGVTTTTSSTTDFAKSGFGTAKGAITVMGSAAASDGSPANDFQLGFGATDLTDEAVEVGWDDHGDGTVDSGRGSDLTDELLMWRRNNNILDGECNFNQLITDGIQTTDANNPNASKLSHAILFGGSDITNFKIGSFESDAIENNSIDVDVGFVPDVVFVIGNGTTSGLAANLQISAGFCANKSGLPQVCHAMSSEDNVGTPVVDQIFRTNRVFAVSQAGSIRALEITAFITSPVNGFEVTTRDGGGNLQPIYVALKFSANVEFDVGSFQTPTSGGIDTVSGLGITPSKVFLVGSTAASADSIVAGGTLAFSQYDAVDALCYSGSCEDNEATGTSNTQSLSDTIALHIPDNDGNDEIKATHSSFSAGSFALNYSDVFGTGRYVGYLALGLKPTAPHPPWPQPENTLLRM